MFAAAFAAVLLIGGAGGANAAPATSAAVKCGEKRILW